MKKNLLFCTIISFLLSCSGSATKDHNTKENPDDTAALSADTLTVIDLNQDISNKSLSELRLLKARVYARQGHCFMEADLRGYFDAHMPSYDSLMMARWEQEDEAGRTGTDYATVPLSPEEIAFIKKIELREAELKKSNFVKAGNVQLANIQNVINWHQFSKLPDAFKEKLAANNFVIIPQENIQLFHVYEKNDYAQLPNFVTTDLYLQLYHMYFSYLLRSLEEKQFIPILRDLCTGMYTQAMHTASSATEAQIKAATEFTAVFYAIPLYLLTGEKKSVPTQYKSIFEQELAAIMSAEDAPSGLMDDNDAYFGYSLFKPRGHYTRSKQLQQYFRAMMWLQTAAQCKDNTVHMERSIVMAQLLLNGKTAENRPLINLYDALFDPVSFLVGMPDNLSIHDITDVLKENSVPDISTALTPAIKSGVENKLTQLLKSRNRIKPGIALTCTDKINFMPQRYLFDNEILQALVDLKPAAARAYPRGLDVFATLGNKTAEQILLHEYHDDEQWTEYNKRLAKMKAQFWNYNGWNQDVYNKWMYSLKQLQTPDNTHPSFMHTDTWARKNLNTSLASWAELKHDAILYSEQPNAAECGGYGPPAPITVGYVEPNVAFWKSMTELLDLTANVLTRQGLMTEDISNKTKQLQESAAFLLSASEKELKGIKLTNQEYNTIELIGSSIEYLTLSIVNPDNVPYSWEEVLGPDKSVAVVADVYTRNVTGCNKNGVLHEATGLVNDIYVVVEIEGYLYLTKGATFSYYEFVRPLNNRLTDEQWQKILDEKKEIPAIPDWLKDIILPSPDDIPVNDEKVFYSSGC